MAERPRTTEQLKLHVQRSTLKNTGLPAHFGEHQHNFRSADASWLMAPDGAEQVMRNVQQHSAWVYLAVQDQFVKIGCTRKQPARRIAQLNASAAIKNWQLHSAHWFLDGFLAERLIHLQLQPFRVQKEVFACELTVACASLSEQIDREQQCWGRFLDLPAVYRADYDHCVLWDELLEAFPDNAD